MTKLKLSLFDIFARLAGSAPKNVPAIDPDENPGRPTNTIRFPPDLRAWITAQADHMGISVQDFVSLTMQGIRIATESPETDEYDTMAMRFFSLFKSHDIPSADIPKFLPEGINIKRSDLRDPNKIIDLLDDKVMNHLADFFNVKRNWLKGLNEYPHESHMFYKNLPAILGEIIRHKSFECEPKVYFLTKAGIGLKELTSSIDDDKGVNTHVYVVLEIKKRMGDNMISTYQLWDSLPWDYWRSRYFAKSLLLFCDKAQISRYAYQIQNEELLWGRELLTNIKKGNIWHLEELVWDDDRNPELYELPKIKEFFEEQKGNLFLDAYRYPYKIKNRERFMSGLEYPSLREE